VERWQSLRVPPNKNVEADENLAPLDFRRLTLIRLDGRPVSRTSFINVDLDVYSSKPLRLLADAMEAANAIALHCGRIAPGRYRASFELGRSPRSADAAIRGLARLIDGLPASARGLWDTAGLRELAVGIEAGNTPFSFTSAIKPNTVAMVSKLRAQISYVIYAPQTK
jgi:hypothetical protein